MPWTNPRVWTVSAPNTTQFNEISEQLAVLHKGNGQTAISSISPNASGQLDIGLVDHGFSVSDPSSHGLMYISSTGREPTNTIHLAMSAAGNIYTNAPTPASGYSPIIVNHETTYGSYNLYQYQLITLFFTGSFWLCNYIINY